MIQGPRAGASSRLALLAVAAVSTLCVACGHATRVGSGPPQDVRASGEWTVVDGVRLQRQRTRVDCGPRALAMVVQRWGLNEAPALAINPGTAGATAGQLRDETRRMGLKAFVFAGRFDDLSHEIDHARPVVIGLVRKEGRHVWSHYVVVVGHDRAGTRWLVADPDTGWRVVTQKDLARDWAASGQVMLAILPASSTSPPPPTGPTPSAPSLPSQPALAPRPAALAPSPG
ncbi:MAG TPA: cysteine peptidase family C39 domain-containing protein [Polyangia bacterium]|nr:cysteine peptidase family C39 domain-containing protein [Polyangia bacterium]